MKRCLATILALSMLLVFSSCQAANAETDETNPVSQLTEVSKEIEVSSLSVEYTWEELCQRVASDIANIKSNTVDEIEADYKKEEFDETEYSEDGYQYIYKYLDNVSTSEWKYLDMKYCVPMCWYNKKTSDTEFINKVSKLCAALELKEISADEANERNNEKILIGDEVMMADHCHGDLLRFTFYGNGVESLDITFYQCTESENILECYFTVKIDDKYFDITNFEDVMAEFHEILVACQEVCVDRDR